MTLESPITAVKGVGMAVAEKFAALGIKTIEDLLHFVPRRYEDFSHITPIAQITPGNITLKAQIESISGRHVRRGLHITEAVLVDESAKTRAIWFNQPYRAAQLKIGEVFYFSGLYELQRNRYLLNNPAIEREADFAISTGRIVPIYPETKGLKSAHIRRVMRELVPLIRILPESLPAQVVRQEGLLDINNALEQLHFPQSAEQLEHAKARIAFEELLELLIASLLNKRDNAAVQSYEIPFLKHSAEQFIAQLPFTLTGAQKRAAWEVLQDIARPTPMNRLLQGDVGSGKTVVAALPAFMAIQSGYQVAVLAPTEILANQHAATLAPLLEPLGVRLALWTGSLKPSAKKRVQQMVAVGEADIVIGTHALLQPDSQFHKLGLVIIDEQHRFGVEQRAQLLAKSRHMPHLLTMTATPIPRSLQLTVYGELEISIINELPAGRLPIHTQLFSPYARKQMYQAIDEQIGQGRQVYVVCPLIDESEQAELKSVEAEYQQLQTATLSHRRLAMLHGQMKADEKEVVMQQFKNGAIDVLVATSVIEVGVDIPNATVILIEGAERFGLAQLHQLRGRVGRGQHQSYCFLMPSAGRRPSERLQELERSQDGFYLAEADLRLRGPGELYGRVQHGALNLRVASLADTKLVARVRRTAESLLATDFNLLQYKQLDKRINRYRGLLSLN